MKRKTCDEVLILLINKMLEPYNVDIEYVKANPKIEGIDWFSYYTWNEEQEEEFEKFFFETLKKELKWSKQKIKKEWPWFNLMWGLRVDESINKENG